MSRSCQDDNIIADAVPVNEPDIQGPEDFSASRCMHLTRADFNELHEPSSCCYLNVSTKFQ
jgi:hypothetical protein